MSNKLEQAFQKFMQTNKGKPTNLEIFHAGYKTGVSVTRQRARDLADKLEKVEEIRAAIPEIPATPPEETEPDPEPVEPTT
jgi:hypothetical protein